MYLSVRMYTTWKDLHMDDQVCVLGNQFLFHSVKTFVYILQLLHPNNP